MKSETNTGFHVCGSGCQNKLRCGFSMAWWEGCRSTGCVWNFKFCSSIIEGNIQLDYLGMSAQIPEVKLWINALFSVEFSAPNWNTELHMGSHLLWLFPIDDHTWACLYESFLCKCFLMFIRTILPELGNKMITMLVCLVTRSAGWLLTYQFHWCHHFCHSVRSAPPDRAFIESINVTHIKAQFLITNILV